MPTGYINHFGIKFTRREVSAIEKEHNGLQLDNFDKKALDRVDEKLKKKGFKYLSLTNLGRNEFGEMEVSWNYIKK